MNHYRCILSPPEEGLPGQPGVVLLDGLQGEEEQEEEQGEAEGRSTPPPNQGPQTTQTVDHQDTVPHAGRRGGGGERRGEEREGERERERGEREIGGGGRLGREGAI